MRLDFWKVIGACETFDEAGVDAALRGIEGRLRSLSPEELVMFHRQLVVKLELLDRDELASIPVRRPGGETWEQSIDGFLYARCACMLAGKEESRRVFSEPGRFAVFVDSAMLSTEELLYLARAEYRRRTGKAMRGVPVPK
ncbi:DUF4240 domain-containing protein [Actinokineospora globicatena]|uniref:DUF4240 domain-containing protein n=1 Tax=Actinokineospora globicatena TaxID=103729 RepID=UPI0025548589|nr:DUF4240 domain-containing protein [Actinokineospora globicatena]